MSAVCPACGVAVVPGYVKCPKCQAALPRRPRTVAAGGTAVKDDRFPVLAVAVPGAIVLVLLLVIMFGDDDDDASDEPQASQPTTTQPVQTATQPQVAPEPDQPTPPTPAGPDPRAAVAELERTLRRQRLWSTMDVAGSNLDVRSAMCDEAAMRQTIEGAAPALRGAGLTRLRCLAQSGAVVFERDL